MKKLISAASAFAMAASMVGTAVPFVTGAADSTKGLELRAFQNRAGEAVSTKISADEIAAGDVTVPIALYLKENTADCEAIKAEWTINSEDGDASNKYVSFTGVMDYDEYFNEAKEYTLSDGSSGSTQQYIGFAGTIEDDYFMLTSGENFFGVAEKQDSSNAKNAWGSVVWTHPKDGSGYKWSGSTSDEYPMFVFEATFAKGTPAGTYTIDFIDLVKDPKFPEVNATMIESPAGKMYKSKNNITLDGITITIGDAGSDKTTSSDDNKTTTTSNTTTASTPKTTTTVSGEPGGEGSSTVTFKTIEDMYVEVPDISVKPGDEPVSVDFIIHSPQNSDGTSKYKASYFSAFLSDMPDGITVELGKKFCDAVPNKRRWEVSGISLQVSTVNPTTSDPVDISDNVSIVNINVTVDASVAGGEYDYGLDRFHVVENAQQGEVSEFDIKVVNGKIKVEGDGTTTSSDKTTTTTTDKKTTTTSDKTTTTTSDKTTTTTTQKQTQAGDPLYGDTNCDNKVNIADVVLLNKWLNDAKSYAITDQGKLNADCCDPKAGEGLDASDSDAIIKRIVHLVELPCEAADLK